MYIESYMLVYIHMACWSMKKFGKHVHYDFKRNFLFGSPGTTWGLCLIISAVAAEHGRHLGIEESDLLG